VFERIANIEMLKYLIGRCTHVLVPGGWVIQIGTGRGCLPLYGLCE